MSIIDFHSKDIKDIELLPVVFLFLWSECVLRCIEDPIVKFDLVHLLCDIKTQFVQRIYHRLIFNVFVVVVA